jgi:hypothetical protein
VRRDTEWDCEYDKHYQDVVTEANYIEARESDSRSITRG